MTEKLNHDDIKERLTEYDSWQQQGPWLRKQFEFDNFEAALNFVNQVGEVAETLNHHPDISIQNYNEVVLHTTTHDVNGVTEKDFSFIDEVEQL